MSNKVRRLHPVAILFKLAKSLKEIIFYIIISFLTLRDNGFFLLGLSIFLSILLIHSILSWYRFTYRIKEDELQINEGIFIRKKRYISKNRIQSINLTENVVHQLFRLVNVQIETASGGNDAEANLKAVNREEGHRIREAFKSKGNEITDVELLTDYEEGEKGSVYTISANRLFIAGTTSGSLGVLLAIIGFLVSEFAQFIPDGLYDSVVTWIVGLSIMLMIGFVIIILIFFWVLGVVGTILKYWKFTITKTGDELYIKRGLLDKKQTTIPIHRIQAVGLKEGLLRQPFGFVTLYVEVAGSAIEKGEDYSTVLFPILKKGEVQAFLMDLLPEYSLLSNEEMKSLPKRSLKYYLIRSTILFLLIGLAVLYFVPALSWYLIPFFLLLLLLGYFRYKDAGFYIEGQHLLIRFRRLSKTTILLPARRIQAMENKQHFFHKKELLETIMFSIIGGQGMGKHYKLKEIETTDAEVLRKWFSNHKNNKKPGSAGAGPKK
ncbi:hypothetical protein D8M04_16275 [Oceanobacillus piezotolerans]|uniref:YdbS-like PH domain-containing protein n=1 Tax=Oceanobacillus piezotolerans TaxID=2448030 RepID=A0A498D370_9BACI|nr:PH domain-containing protein [Oceanobacillus piezotolerans]RLL42162.1 hypothetical protein D8M04_16275 [Oceanobacillus piezotolerans]